MASGLKFLFCTRTLFEQCTYLGYLLLEAPREYVQHGPLMSINWLRFCPQFGARMRSHAIQRRLFIVLMTAAYISPNVYSLRNFLSNIHGLFLTIHSTSFISIIHHIHTTIVSFIYMTHSHFHSFGSSWQAGCPRSLVSDTGRDKVIQNFLQEICGIHEQFAAVKTVQHHWLNSGACLP
jgi:hypothetical protein